MRLLLGPAGAGTEAVCSGARAQVVYSDEGWRRPQDLGKACPPGGCPGCPTGITQQLEDMPQVFVLGCPCAFSPGGHWAPLWALRGVGGPKSEG